MANPQTVWTPQSAATGASPRIGDQFIGMGQQVLCLRRPFLEVSVLMALMYSVTIVGWIPFAFWLQWTSPKIPTEFGAPNPWFEALFNVLLYAAPIVCFGPFLALNLRRLKMSHIYFNRHTQRVYAKEGHHLYVADWHGVQATPNSFVDASNVGAVTRFRLEMLLPSVHPLPPHRFWQKRLPPGMLWFRIMSNAQTDPRIEYVAQVWEYIRVFMAHGPEGLPIPAEPNWWMLPLHKVVLTPLEAWRHYVPWRTGEAGEHQGKKSWLLPFWAVLFPLTMSVSLCWWVVCCIFGICPSAPPPEALEGETRPLVTVEMTCKGIRP
ncbi:DUF6708 domain-containing protein [Caballeronia sp. SL2Y3]|uniref:DUF6708 domain-containing protein n=1 Tax=Caballeronia sp. SL2Y3 TaxID=2878151 RepID=UPI001FD23747|nr:DUF6708 domain-containing protein [Caballeronia sp. SL2Y3]